MAVIKIPENATNGDVINALFPNAKDIRVDGGYPHYGYKRSVISEMNFGDDYPEVFKEGEETITCPECGYTFNLIKKLSWEYTTEIIAK